MLSHYKSLKQNIFSKDKYALVPIRFEDRYEIMQWRNEQIYHLRQAKPLTKEDQDTYFKNVVAKLFDQDQPNQILFSFLNDGICIGYGGLVHINWIDKNAEVSFIMNTELEEKHFHDYWSIYLNLIEEIGFKELLFHKLFVHAFDLRPHLYEVLLDNNYFQDAKLKEHCFFNDEFIDVVIHSKIA